VLFCALALAALPWPSPPVAETVHPEFVRGEFAGEAPYWLELTPGAGGYCQGGGVQVGVRRDLHASSESFDLGTVPGPLQATCDGLDALGPAAIAAMAEARALAEAGAASRPGPDGRPRPPSEKVALGGGEERAIARWHPRAFHLVVTAWFLVLFPWLWRSRHWAMIPAGLLALGLRLRLPETVILGGDAAYERLQTALGRGTADRYYGESWPSLYGALAQAMHALGADVTALAHSLNLCFSVATACVAVALGRQGSWLAGLTLAAAAWPVALARAEDHVVLVAFFQVLAVAALACKGGHRLAALSLVMLGHLRPEQLAVAGLLSLGLWKHPRWLVVTVLALASRLAYLPPPSGSVPIPWGRLLDPVAWPQMAGAYGLVAALPLLALALYSRARWPLLLLAVNALLYLPKTQPLADPLRFGLLVHTWLLVAAALGAARAVFHVKHRARWLAPLGLLAAFWMPPSTRPYTWEAEYRFLREALPRGEGLDANLARATEAGWYDASLDPNGAMGNWMSLRTGFPWRALGSATPALGDWLYRGSADHLAAAWAGAAMGLDVVQEARVPAASDGWVDYGEGEVSLGLYRVNDPGQR